MLQYAQMLQAAATLLESNYYNALFCSYYEEEEILQVIQQHNKQLYNYIVKLEQNLYTHFINVCFAVLRYNERCAS